MKGAAGDCLLVFDECALVSLLALFAWLSIFILVIIIISLTLVFVDSLETLGQALLEVLGPDTFEEV